MVRFCLLLFDEELKEEHSVTSVASSSVLPQVSTGLLPNDGCDVGPYAFVACSKFCQFRAPERPRAMSDGLQ